MWFCRAAQNDCLMSSEIQIWLLDFVCLSFGLKHPKQNFISVFLKYEMLKSTEAQNCSAVTKLCISRLENFLS